ncbi:hypothetical protein [Methylomonas sp. HYX-M1]|uniref:hypothetical protein n=1 Tax=Methylomonas sp. HYX-M1 TaxID=3139307 RepID=UPI00345BFFC2
MCIFKKIFKYFAVALILIGIFISILNNDNIASLIHSELNIYQQVTAGKAKIKKPANWIMTFKKDNDGSAFETGYFYGIVPAIFFKNEFIGIKYFYIFHDIKDANKEIIFAGLDDKHIAKAKEMIKKVQESEVSSKYDIKNISGFNGIVIKSNDREIIYSVTIPDLSLYIMLNSLDDLKDFKLSLESLS